TRRNPSWRSALERTIAAADAADRLERNGIDPIRIAELSTPPEIAFESLAPQRGAGERLAAIVAVFLIIGGTMTAMGYVFASITADKQNRVTEQIISAVTPQQWMDGKLLGLSAITAVSLLVTIMAFATLALVLVM